MLDTYNIQVDYCSLDFLSLFVKKQLDIARIETKIMKLLI